MAEKKKIIKENRINTKLSHGGFTGLRPMMDYPIGGSRYLGESASIDPKALVAPYDPTTYYGMSVGLNYERTYDVLEELEKIYFNDPLIHSSISIISTAVIDDGYDIVGGDDKYKEFIDNFFDFMSIDDKLQNIVKCLMIYGEAFIEIVYRPTKGKSRRTDKNLAGKDRFNREVAGVRVINPKNMVIVRDAFGKYVDYTPATGKYAGKKLKLAYAQLATNIVQQYGYTFGGSNKLWEQLSDNQYVFFEPDEMIHIKFGEVGDAGYGLSTLYPLRTISYQRRQLELDAVRLVHFYAKPIYMFRLGDEKTSNPANQYEIDQFVAQLNNRKPDEHLVTTTNAQASVLGAFDAALDPVPLTQFLMEISTLAVRVPSTVVGASSKGAFGGGVVQAQVQVFHTLIRCIQKLIKNKFRNRLFPLICYHQDRDNRKADVRKGGAKKYVSSPDEIMFSGEFMKRVPKMKFYPIEPELEKHKRVVEQYAAGMIPLETSQNLISIEQEELDGEYYQDKEMRLEKKLQTAILKLQHQQAMELTKLTAAVMPKPVAGSSGGAKPATRTGKGAGSRTDKKVTGLPKKTGKVGTGTAPIKTTVPKVDKTTKKSDGTD